MRIEKKKLKTVVLSLALAGMMWPANVIAQQGGLMGYGKTTETQNQSFFGKGGGSVDGLGLQNFGEYDDDLTLQNFGQEVPLGSGWLILMASGAGYAALKSRKKQNTKKK